MNTSDKHPTDPKRLPDFDDQDAEIQASTSEAPQQSARSTRLTSLILLAIGLLVLGMILKSAVGDFILLNQVSAGDKPTISD